MIGGGESFKALNQEVYFPIILIFLGLSIYFFRKFRSRMETVDFDVDKEEAMKKVRLYQIAFGVSSLAFIISLAFTLMHLD